MIDVIEESSIPKEDEDGSGEKEDSDDLPGVDA